MVAFRLQEHQDHDDEIYARHHHSSYSYPSLRSTSTASIPINPDSIRKTASEHQMAMNEAEAEYKDFVFFSRVVDGMSRQNSLLEDGSSLKSMNESLIGNLVKSRHEDEEDDSANNYYKEYNINADTDNQHQLQALYYRNCTSQFHEEFNIVTPVMNVSPLYAPSRTGDYDEGAAAAESEQSLCDSMTSVSLSRYDQEDSGFDYYQGEQPADDDNDNDGEGIFDLEL